MDSSLADHLFLQVHFPPVLLLLQLGFNALPSPALPVQILHPTLLDFSFSLQPLLLPLLLVDSCEVFLKAFECLIAGVVTVDVVVGLHIAAVDEVACACAD